MAGKTVFRKTKNRAQSTVAAGGSLNNVTDPVTFNVTAAGGAFFPATFPFFITVENEIMRCTNRVVDALTVDRAQEGTAAAAHADGVAVELRATGGMVDEITAAINAVEDGQGNSIVTKTLTVVGDTIPSTTRVVRLNNTSGGLLDLTSNPQVAAGTVDGQLLTLIVISAGVNTVKLDTGTGLFLNAVAGSFTMVQYDVLDLVWSVAASLWLERTRSHNA